MAFRPTIADISLKNLIHNYKLICKTLPKSSFVCPMIKANAYGHGDKEVARALSKAGAKKFGVCLIEEAVKLRDSKISSEILTFDIFDREGAKAVVDYNLSPALSSWDQLAALEKVKNKKPINVHLKFNTGMNRLGFELSDAKKLQVHIYKHKKLNLVGICTHLAVGEDAGVEGGVTDGQLRRLNELKNIFKDQEFHALNSSAIFGLAQNNLGLGARPGLSLYGIKPDSKVGADPELRPVMSLVSHLSLVRALKRGEKVSYGGRWEALKDSIIGVVPVGYEDGYFRALSNKAYMIVRDIFCPVIGTVCMDYTMIDLSMVASAHNVKVGDRVTILGREKSSEILASDIAKWATTISYEVLTSVGARVPRIY
ncbi:MAG: alanine racemase [Pseudomonadota bacterium]|nr:alanine racemase [Pseudomonadota bacterium]